MSAPASGLIRFTNANADTLDIPIPIYPYMVVVEPAIDRQIMSNGRWTSNDYTATYDRRYCECSIEMTSAQAVAFADWFRSSGTTHGRGQGLTLEGASDSGFCPFGPDKGAAGPFSVAVDVLDIGGQLSDPFKYFRPRLRIYNTSTYPEYTAPAQVDSGEWAIGTVTGLRMPTNWWEPVTALGDYKTRMEGGAVNYVDRGGGSSAGDRHTVIASISETSGNTAAILTYLLGTVRGNTFTLTTPTSDGATTHFPFGPNHLSGSDTAQWIQEQLMLTHSQHNRWDYQLEFSCSNTVLWGAGV